VPASASVEEAGEVRACPPCEEGAVAVVAVEEASYAGGGASDIDAYSSSSESLRRTGSAGAMDCSGGGGGARPGRGGSKCGGSGRETVLAVLAEPDGDKLVGVIAEEDA